MEIYGNIVNENIKTNNKTAVALGKFDGLHKGHRLLVSRIREAKENKGYKAVIFTFAKSPKEFLEKESQKYILTSYEKRYFMEANGMDILVECPLEKEILTMEPEMFIKEVLVDKLSAKEIFCGEDFRFGYKRKGDVSFLKNLEDKYGYKTNVIKKLQYNDRDISSTYIREEIVAGNLENVNKMLGYAYTIIGVVTEGNKIGRTIGFPTVNIEPEEDKLLLPNGVYYTETIVEGKKYASVTNIGTKPTVSGENKITVETNIINMSKDLYGKVIEVRFLEFIRPEKRFNSLEELKKAVDLDIKFCCEKTVNKNIQG